jgi:hypothetical protein
VEGFIYGLSLSGQGRREGRREGTEVLSGFFGVDLRVSESYLL